MVNFGAAEIRVTVEMQPGQSIEECLQRARPIIDKVDKLPNNQKQLKALKGMVIPQLNAIPVRHTAGFLVRERYRFGSSVELVLKKPVLYNNHPTFLGVTFDGRLNFHEHHQRVKKRMWRKMSVMSRLTGSTWGCTKLVLRTVYMSSVQAVATYCLGVYGSRLSDTKRAELISRE